MYQVEDEPIETIHLCVVREQERRPYTVFPLFCAFLCLLGIAAVTVYSAQHPYYEHKRLTVPAIFLPLKVFTASAPIIPTGIKTYPATFSHGILTLSNGSVISQILPANFIISVKGSFQVVTDESVYVPPATANGFGMSTVSAHLLTSGVNMSTLSINEVIGSSLFIRNLSPFTGGKPAYSVKFVTQQDRETALIEARVVLRNRTTGNLHYPCSEDHDADNGKVIVTWRCQFVIFKVPAFMHVSAARLIGKNFIVDVMFVPPPKQIWVK